MIRTCGPGSGAAKVSVLPLLCTDVQQCVQLYSKEEAGDNAECAVSLSWEPARRGAESDKRVTSGDKSDMEPGETKGHCAAGPHSEYKSM